MFTNLVVLHYTAQFGTTQSTFGGLKTPQKVYKRSLIHEILNPDIQNPELQLSQRSL